MIEASKPEVVDGMVDDVCAYVVDLLKSRANLATISGFEIGLKVGDAFRQECREAGISDE